MPNNIPFYSQTDAEWRTQRQGFLIFVTNTFLIFIDSYGMVYKLNAT